MAFALSGDVYNDISAYYDEEDRFYESLPICCRCREKIEDEYLIEYDGELYHEECFDEYLNDLKTESRHPICNYLEEQ